MALNQNRETFPWFPLKIDPKPGTLKHNKHTPMVVANPRSWGVSLGLLGAQHKDRATLQFEQLRFCGMECVGASCIASTFPILFRDPSFQETIKKPGKQLVFAKNDG